MISFGQLLQKLEENKQKENIKNNELAAILRLGNNLDKKSFWENFISICSNTKELSELLGVSEDRVRSWPSKIRKKLETLDTYNIEDLGEKEKIKIMPTGDNGAFVTK